MNPFVATSIAISCRVFQGRSTRHLFGKPLSRNHLAGDERILRQSCAAHRTGPQEIRGLGRQATPKIPVRYTSVRLVGQQVGDNLGERTAEALHG
jgi:hypothetical protein